MKTANNIITAPYIIENWKDIEGYEDYQVSDLGRVKSFKKNQERILKLNVDGRGYYVVNLMKAGKQKTVNVHRLVVETFVPAIVGLTVTDHINQNKLDNRAVNLRWVTVRDNILNTSTTRTSIYRGITWVKNRKNWRATIMNNGKSVFLGSFQEETEAARAYDNALTELGLAPINFPLN